MSKKIGFTLIELLVVVAIIAIIGSLLIISISASRGKGRDAKRIADIGSIQIAVESYRDKTGTYPTTRIGASGSGYVESYNSTCVGTCDGIVKNWKTSGSADSLQNKLLDYVQVLPVDPIDGKEYKVGTNTYNYKYQYGATPANYKLTAHLEQNNEAMLNTNDGGISDDLYEVFTNGAQPWFTNMCLASGCI